MDTQPPRHTIAGHTAFDAGRLLADDRDPATVQPREHPVPCRTCHTATWNLHAICDTCA